MTALIAAISATALDLSAHLAAVNSASCGAVSTFIGQVRDHDPEARGTVAELEYSAHPDAEAILRDIVEQHATPECLVAVSHRVGTLAIGDLALVVCVATPHRALAFDVCRRIVEAVKIELPVWKKQREADGSDAWVGL